LGRRVVSPELSPSDPIIGARARAGIEKPKASGPQTAQAQEQAILLWAEEVDDSSVTGSARGAGLLGSPLPFDLDSLGREAQQFFAQIDQLSQDLASLLARLNLSPWAVAAAVTATAAAVVRRRLRRGQHGLVLTGSEGTEFTFHPGLGGALDMSTVLSGDNG
jgi:hypothetical protein